MIGLPQLTWFPKPFSAGDTDGAGAQKTLGNPDLDLPTLLVRETAQNSWDARIPGQIPLFDMRLRLLDNNVRDVLRWNIFRNGMAPNLGLDEMLDAPTLWALEISDRGTKGLGGPTRNDLEPPAGQPTDYMDFVLTLGAPPDTDAGGGTFGFGKTAIYNASACGTVLIWSRTGADAGPQERFIASAMGTSFERGGHVFTGRQWWAVPGAEARPDDFLRFEPVTGAMAEQLGAAVFERTFLEGETGTSLLILQPHGCDEPDQLVRQWADALSRYLWPKMPTDQPLERQMHISLSSPGGEHPLDSPTTSTVLAARMRCLNAIRQEQAGSDEPADSMVRLMPIAALRPKMLLGHLAMTQVPKLPDGQSYPDDTTVDSVSYMRNKAELIVRDEPLGPMATGISDWVGVFRTTAELDPVFAEAEPPAHDSWNARSPKEKRARTFVNVALRNIRADTERYRNPSWNATPSGESAPTGVLSAELAGLMVETGAVSAASHSPTRRRVSRANPGSRASARVIEAQPVPRSLNDIAEGRQTTRALIAVSGTAPSVRVTLDRLDIAIDGGKRLESDNELRVIKWLIDGSPAVPEYSTAGTQSVRAAPGQQIATDISFPVDMAVDFSFSAKEA
ncbi:hypothetical protein EFN10_00780 [Propionibacterium freudenreichii]|uniref:hypothetical protein n=1 Tax=Propionibacterium freudenreichii TaxID=1744 RepID=UPI0021A504C2|nr:hypothetical protein [Propionibacterium freudenreichii]MCT2994682.1 hypothetical protein [Propionibacterium freudenreichii]